MTARVFRRRLRHVGKRRKAPHRLTVTGSPNGRVVPPAARATAGMASSADHADPPRRCRKIPSPSMPAGKSGKPRTAVAEPGRDPEAPAGHRWHNGSRGTAPRSPGTHHRRSSTTADPSIAPPRSSTADWQPEGPAGKSRWQRSVTPRMGERWGQRIPKMHSSRRGSSPLIVPLDSPPRRPHLAARPMAEIHTADLSSLDSDALKSRLTQLGRYL